MRYLLDSDWLIDLLEGVPETLAKVDAIVGQGLATSAVNYLEVTEGILNSSDPDAAHSAFERICETISILPFDRPEATRCAMVRDHLRRHGRRVKPRALDLMVAATAIEHGLQLVTRNRGDYHDVPGLVLAG